METKPASRMPVLLWLIASQVLALVSLIVWLVVAGFSAASFAIQAYPIWPVAFAVAAWVAYARNKDLLAALLTAVALLPMLAMLVTFLLPSFTGPAPL